MIRVLAVDNLELICVELKEMFVMRDDISIIDFACNGEEAIQKIEQQKPDIVLIDILMPVMGGIEAIREISTLYPQIKIVILSSLENDPQVLKAIAAGAKGYLLKNMRAEDMAIAIQSVYRGALHFAPGVLNKSTVSQQLGQKVDNVKTISNDGKSATATRIKDKTEKTSSGDRDTATKTPIQPIKTSSRSPKGAKPKPNKEKPLFDYGDWISVIFGVVALSQTNGMGHHLAHAGLFFLMIALVARPIQFFWGKPLKYRRTIGIFAFAAALAHAIYATLHVLNGHPTMILSMTHKNQFGIYAGIIALAMMTPAAATSFKYFQRKLGVKKWRKIHLWTVPALALGVLHTVLIGPHYMSEMSESKMQILDYIRTYAMLIVGLLVFAMRREFFWSFLGWNKMGKWEKVKKN